MSARCLWGVLNNFLQQFGISWEGIVKGRFMMITSNVDFRGVFKYLSKNVHMKPIFINNNLFAHKMCVFVINTTCLNFKGLVSVKISKNNCHIAASHV